MFLEAVWELGKGQEVMDAVEEFAGDVSVVAASNEAIIVSVKDGSMDKDKLQDIIHEINHGFWCEIEEVSEDSLFERGLI